MNFLYNTVLGRFLLLILLNSGMLKIAAKWVKSPLSKGKIRRFIKKHNIDMSEYEGQTFDSFAEFFARKKEVIPDNYDQNVFISPCDGLLSVFEINDDSVFKVKNSYYSMSDLIPEKDTADMFKNGLCLIFRLEATDYHRFCYIDDGYENGQTLIPGKLHSVQPVAINRYPVYRQNRRYYHLLNTKNFGPVMQIEVGAVLVGDVLYTVPKGDVKRAQECGNFELWGSTIMMFLSEETAKKFTLNEDIINTLKSSEECPVKYAKAIGYLKG